MDSLSASIWRCRYLCRRTKIRIFKSLVIPVLLYGCETWTLNTNLKRQIDVFGNKCLCSIMKYHWNNLGVKSATAPWDWIKTYYQITNIVRKVNSGMWIILGGGGQGGAHKVRGWGKSMLPVESYLVWEGGLHGDLHGVITGAGVGGLARWRVPWHMPPMID